MKKYTEAEIEANSMLRENNRNADALYVRGLCLYYQDYEDEAFQCFTSALKIDPDHKKAKAIQKKAKLLKSTKDDGNEAYKTGKFQEAYDLYSNALEIDPNNVSTCAKLFYNRGVVASRNARRLANQRPQVACIETLIGWIRSRAVTKVHLDFFPGFTCSCPAISVNSIEETKELRLGSLAITN
ncbi:dnaJ homolog subfamily C member 7-like [Dendronephthya gigantea]|uniref:dnaJ homolog subfamily C member 7-like n=1 Tax=Dendronephthya gigantea TaxID=151771 RepID=UPI001069B3CA|nr:dnaJ homolog subfamily C member 7-like [Dendronephthya gigantea]